MILIPPRSSGKSFSGKTSIPVKNLLKINYNKWTRVRLHQDPN